jgi:hypothetical protein
MSLRSVNDILDKMDKGWTLAVAEKANGVDYLVSSPSGAGDYLIPQAAGYYMLKNSKLEKVETLNRKGYSVYTVYKKPWRP